MGESPRWHDGELWLSDWGAREIVALDPGGQRTLMLAMPFDLPFCFDWRSDGPLLVVAGREARVMRRAETSRSSRLPTSADFRKV